MKNILIITSDSELAAKIGAALNILQTTTTRLYSLDGLEHLEKPDAIILGNFSRDGGFGFIESIKDTFDDDNLKVIVIDEEAVRDNAERHADAFLAEDDLGKLANTLEE